MYEIIIAIAKALYTAYSNDRENKQRVAQLAAELRDNNDVLIAQIGELIRSIIAEHDYEDIKRTLNTLVTFLSNFNETGTVTLLDTIIRDAEYAINLSLSEVSPNIRQQAVLTHIALAGIRLNAMVQKSKTERRWLNAARTDARRYIDQVRETYQKLIASAQARVSGQVWAESAGYLRGNPEQGTDSLCHALIKYYVDGNAVKQSFHESPYNPGFSACERKCDEFQAAIDQERLSVQQGFVDQLPNSTITEVINAWQVFADGGVIRGPFRLRSGDRIVRIGRREADQLAQDKDPGSDFEVVTDASGNHFLRLVGKGYVRSQNGTLEIDPLAFGILEGSPTPSPGKTFAVEEMDDGQLSVLTYEDELKEGESDPLTRVRQQSSRKTWMAVPVDRSEEPARDRK